MEFEEQPMILRLWQHRVVRKSVDSLSREGSSPSTDTKFPDAHRVGWDIALIISTKK